MTTHDNPPTGPISGRALAKLLGLKSETAVRTAKAAGRLRRCVVPGGYDAAIAIEEWQANTDPRQQRRTTAATDAAAAADAKRTRRPEATLPASAKGRERAKTRVAAPTPPDGPPSPSPAPAGREATDLHARLAAHREKNRVASAPKGGGDEPDAPTDGGRTIAEIRRDMLLVEEQSALLDWHEKVGAALPRDLTLANVMTLGREYRDSVLRIADQYAPQIAGELGLEAHVVHAVLDRYLLLHFEKHIEKIDPAKVAPSLDAGA